METTLATSGDNCFSLVNACPDATAVMRLSDGCGLTVNESFTALTGYVAAECQAGTWISAEDWRRLATQAQPNGQAVRLAVALHT